MTDLDPAPTATDATGPAPIELDVATAHEAIAAAVPERDCLIWRDQRFTWADTTRRTRALAHVLRAQGMGRHTAEADVAPWESPNDHVALYLTNGPEYLEGMLGAYKARTAPVNINYRYVLEELVYVLRDAAPKAVIVHARYTPLLAEALAVLGTDPLVLQVADESGHDLLPGAVDYEAALAAAPTTPLDDAPSPDDRYIVYTGGTTGMPKGVLWRQADFLVGAAGVRRRDGSEYTSLEELVAVAQRRTVRTCPAPPLMHGAAHWNAISAWMNGGAVVIQDETVRFDPHDVLATIDRHQVTALNIVGDAFARPLVEAIDAGSYDLSSLRHLVSGGAVLSGAVKRELAQRMPHVTIVDVVGSSESGRQAEASGAGATTFTPLSTAAVLSDDRTRLLAPGEDEIGWLAQRGRVPLGYMGDPAKTDATFPTVDGTRYVVAGDRARLLADGRVELLGRESVTINTGGEKVFAEEVELALKQHPALYDALVVGRPSERWGQEVVAVVRVVDGHEVSDEELLATAAERIARYKLPKAIVRVGEIARSASGKPDYAWARQVAIDAQAEDAPAS